MIIRNPYSIVVKHYKLINFLLIVPMIYLIFKFGDIAGFFKDYIAAGYTTPETEIVDSYITGLTFIAIIFMLISNILLYIIFVSKKKNSLVYFINVIYYIVLLVATLLFSSSMASIEKNSLDATFANFVRDCSIICYLPLYLQVFFNITKAVGFNFKTLQFDNNSDLKISEEDEEDIEIKIGSDNNTVKKSLVHTIRELKYYVLENKFVFTCIGIFFLLIIGFNLYKNYQVYNKTYIINQAFNLDNFTLSVKESYITDTDYRGIIITKDKYYLAIRIGLINNGEDTKISDSHFRIYDGKDIIYPSYDKSARFIDIGEAYQGELIREKEEHEYVFVYELTKDQIKNTYQMRILNNLSEKNGKIIKSYRKITVKPRNITKTQGLGVLNYNDEVKLKDTTLGKTNFKIKSLQIATSYSYTYEQCASKDNCTNIIDTIVPSTGNILFIVKDEINLDESVPYYKYKYKDFYIDFSSLIYEFDVKSGRDAGTKVRTTNLKNITPKVLKDTKVYEVPNTMLNANKINLEIRIRNKYMTMVIRE